MNTRQRRSEPAIKVNDISITLGNKNILSHITFRIHQGEILGLIGPNGAGKSTLLYIMMGLLIPRTGNITILGQDLNYQNRDCLRIMNYASSSMKLNGFASVSENLLTFAGLYGVKEPKKKIAELTEYLGISSLLRTNTKVFRLSQGENTKVNICKALLFTPKILLLDEITAHLDSRSKELVLRYLINLRDSFGTTIVFVTHNDHESDKFCDRKILMQNGTIKKIKGK